MLLQIQLLAFAARAGELGDRSPHPLSAHTCLSGFCSAIWARRS